MAEAISANDARRKVALGEALLVCAYSKPEKCRDMGVRDARPLAEFQAQKRSLGNREVFFICG